MQTQRHITVNNILVRSYWEVKFIVTDGWKGNRSGVFWGMIGAIASGMKLSLSLNKPSIIYSIKYSKNCRTQYDELNWFETDPWPICLIVFLYVCKMYSKVIYLSQKKIFFVLSCIFLGCIFYLQMYWIIRKKTTHLSIILHESISYAWRQFKFNKNIKKMQFKIIETI